MNLINFLNQSEQKLNKKSVKHLKWLLNGLNILEISNLTKEKLQDWLFNLFTILWQKDAPFELFLTFITKKDLTKTIALNDYITFKKYYNQFNIDLITLTNETKLDYNLVFVLYYNNKLYWFNFDILYFWQSKFAMINKYDNVFITNDILVNYEPLAFKTKNNDLDILSWNYLYLFFLLYDFNLTWLQYYHLRNNNSYLITAHSKIPDLHYTQDETLITNLYQIFYDFLKSHKYKLKKTLVNDTLIWNDEINNLFSKTFATYQDFNYHHLIINNEKAKIPKIPLAKYFKHQDELYELNLTPSLVLIDWNEDNILLNEDEIIPDDELNEVVLDEFKQNNISIPEKQINFEALFYEAWAIANQ